ncbi:MAG: DUF2079 domain-containing protein, partial [Myxococcota bacterium]
MRGHSTQAAFRRRLTRLLPGALALLAFAVTLAGVEARYATFHNRTFDLAFYARMAWGLAGNDWWDPLVGAHVLGLHVSPVLVPLGVLGRLIGDPVRVLMVAQSAALVGAGLCIARAGRRWLGPAGAVLGVLTVVLHPNALHAATYEVHPGTLALLPMAYALERLDAADLRGLLVGCLGMLLCREDLALVTAALGVLAWPTSRRVAIGLVASSGAYLALFLFVFFPEHAPETGSFQLHFGKWGDSFGEVFATWRADPGTLAAHLAQPGKLSFVPRAILPYALLPLLAPRWWLPALPTLLIAQISDFPTTDDLDSHYLTPALPALAMATLAGLHRLAGGRERPARLGLVAVSGTLGVAVAVVGPHPTQAAFHPDARQPAGRDVVARVRGADAAAGTEVGFQGPDALLPHLAARRRLHRGPPPERGDRFVAFDLTHRVRWAHDETLLRTEEEEPLRAWLARPDHGVVLHQPPFLLLERGKDPRRGLGAAYFLPEPSVAARGTPGVALSACLRVERAERTAAGVALVLRAERGCPSDLALRLGPVPQPGSARALRGPRRVDLLFDGVLSPAHLRPGDRVRSAQWSWPQKIRQL